MYNSNIRELLKALVSRYRLLIWAYKLEKGLKHEGKADYSDPRNRRQPNDMHLKLRIPPRMLIQPQTIPSMIYHQLSLKIDPISWRSWIRYHEP